MASFSPTPKEKDVQFERETRFVAALYQQLRRPEPASRAKEPERAEAPPRVREQHQSRDLPGVPLDY